jgi:hypothetical protein
MFQMLLFSFKKGMMCQAVVAHAFNPSTREAEASLVYRGSSRTARATKRKTCLEKKKKKQKQSGGGYNVVVLSFLVSVSCFFSWFLST